MVTHLINKYFILEKDTMTAILTDKTSKMCVCVCGRAPLAYYQTQLLAAMGALFSPTGAVILSPQAE